MNKDRLDTIEQVEQFLWHTPARGAAHLADHVFPRLAVRQWVLSVPKRLRYFLQCGGQTHRPLYIGKPTFAIEVSRHLVGIVIDRLFRILTGRCQSYAGIAFGNLNGRSWPISATQNSY